MRYPLLLAVISLAACSDQDPIAGHPQLGDPVRGQTAFVINCSQCHASHDGFDLAAFRFADTTIIRRAVAHVDTGTARDIVAHVRSLQGAALDRNFRIFQPGDYVAASDADFAIRLFGADAWPVNLTTAGLRAIDPRMVRVALQMPAWSDERTNLDWMPDSPLPPGVLDDQGSLARGALAGYRAAPTRENLVRAVSALRTADRRMGNPAAPCLLEDSLRVNFVACFEVRRWASSLVAQHMVRHGTADFLDPVLHDVWWDVGNAARKSIRNGVSPIANARQNWAEWMYLSWSFDPSRHPSVYTGGGLNGIGLPRHATFIALRSQVARMPRSVTPYSDLQSAMNFAPTAWAHSVATFGFGHLVERLESGDRPSPESLQTARDALTQAFTTAQRKIPAAQINNVRELRDRALTLLQ
jgi:hypothetical protein